jgi:prophage tail gpP-like protein
MIEVRVAGKKYSDWIESELSRSIDNASGQGSFKISKFVPDIDSGQLIEIFVDGEAHLTGYVDDNDNDCGEESLTQTFSVRDKIADFLDSSLPDSVKKLKAGTDAVTLLKKVLKALNMDIGVTNNAGTIKAFSSNEIIAGESGVSAFNFVSDHLRKRSLFLNSDGKGNAVLYKLVSDITPTFSFENIIDGNNNVITAKKKTDYSNRYRFYVCKSQASSGSDYGDSGTVNRIGKAEDKEIRNTRYLEFVAEESMTTAECKARAEEEANIRRARSLEYTVTVAGHSQDGRVFNIGYGARVYDEVNRISGVLLIRSVRLKSSADGDTTEINMTYPDAYSVEANMTQKAQKRIDLNKKPKGGLL